MSGKPKKNSYGYTLGEEIANAVTHGLGTLLAAAGTVVMIVFAALKGDPWFCSTGLLVGYCSVLCGESVFWGSSSIPSASNGLKKSR